ncbi:hypothetical protein MMC07_001368 [Pseudocyphellaria aurata]|nr:hypothetical protein [Pseudocyphellaria aurata]
MESQGDQSVCTPPFTSQPSPSLGTNSDLPRPRYFLARQDGTITPLVAVDELPDTVRIVGAPATISPAATVNMMSLGLVDRSQHKYIVETSTISVDSNPGKLSPPSIAQGSNSSIPEKPHVASNEVHKGTTDSGAKGVEQWRQDVKSIDETQAAIDAVIDANEHATAAHASHADAGTPGTYGKKIYCTHWIRWGECDYTQQGCLYKHEMPDEPTLNSIGIRTIPKWYRDINAPKNGWVGRPAPADQLWRGKQTRPAQPPQPLKPFPGPAQPTKPFAFPVRPVSAPRPTTNGPFTGPAPPHRQPAPLGPKVFGRANQAPEQQYASSFFSAAQTQAMAGPSTLHTLLQPMQSNQPISAPPVLNATQQPLQSFTTPSLAPFTSPQITVRNTNLHNGSSALTSNYRPLTPHNPTPAASNSVPASVPKSTSSAYVEPQTPVPIHRRLFVPAGEPAYVTNPVPAGEGKGKAKESKKGGKGLHGGVNGHSSGSANGNGKGIGNGNGKGSGNGNGKGGGNGNGKGSGNGKTNCDFLLDLE